MDLFSKINVKLLTSLLILSFFYSCENGTEESSKDSEVKVEEEEFGDDFFKAETVGEIDFFRTSIPRADWNKLNLLEKKFIYYLVQSGIVANDITLDQLSSENLEIKYALEDIYFNDNEREKESENWKELKSYIHSFWHNSRVIMPFTSKPWLLEKLKERNIKLSESASKLLFTGALPEFSNEDFLMSSSSNFYSKNMSSAEAIEFYEEQDQKASEEDMPVGLASKLIKENEEFKELDYKVDGLYGEYLSESINWLKKAKEIAPNPEEKSYLASLIKLYQNPRTEEWKQNTIDFVNCSKSQFGGVIGFLETYNDPLYRKGSYQSVVYMEDQKFNRIAETFTQNAQWFEDHLPFEENFKNSSAKAIDCKVVNLIHASGDCYVSDVPNGVTLPNSNYIMENHGARNLIFSNVLGVSNRLKDKGLLSEFSPSEEALVRGISRGKEGSLLSAILYSTYGFSLGKTQSELEFREVFLDKTIDIEDLYSELLTLYFIMDPKMIELDLIAGKEVAMSKYDNLVTIGNIMIYASLKSGDSISDLNGFLKTLAYINSWIIKQDEEVIKRFKKNEKTYFEIQDYDRFYELITAMFKQVGEMKLSGDLEGFNEFLETYDYAVEDEDISHFSERINGIDLSTQYSLLHPKLTAVKDGEGNITDVKIEYHESFESQMREFYEKSPRVVN